MTWQITLNHVCTVLYDISLLAQAYRCMQMFPQTLLFKSAEWHGTFDMIISHLSDLTSPSSDRRCQRRWEMMATLNTNLEKLWWKLKRRRLTENVILQRTRIGIFFLLRHARMASPKNVGQKNLLKYEEGKLLRMWLFLSCRPTH